MEMKTEPLIEEYRNGLLECIHCGTICVVDKNGILASIGDTEWISYYRSASKGIQVLPLIERRLEQKYGLTPQETAIFSGSHWGDYEHIHALESIMEKTGLKEKDMIMNPTYPQRISVRNELIQEGKEPRKIYHNCSGKHLGMMLLTRELGLPVEDYWKRGTKTQEEILKTISEMTDVPKEDIKVGVDGCGVPVYAVPFRTIAVSYMRLANPELIKNDKLAEAVERNTRYIHTYPNMIAGRDIVCSILCSDENLIAKSGALGIYVMGIKSLGLGVVCKTMDGSHDEFEQCALHILKQLGYRSVATELLAKLYPNTIVNDNLEVVGEKKVVFQLHH